MTAPTAIGVWFMAAERSRLGICDVCHRDRGDDGRPLPVVRVRNGRLFKCFTCSTTKRRRKPVTTTTRTVTGLQKLPLAKLKASDENRDVGDVAELAASIKEQGLVQPIVAVQQNGHFLIVAGARRAAAAKKAGLKEIDVLVREFTDTDRLLAMAAENLHREDLTPLEEAELYRLLSETGLTQAQLAKKVSKSQGHISKRLALLKLPDDVRTRIDSGGIPLADAVEYARLAEHPERLRAAIGQTNEWRPAANAVENELLTLEVEKNMQAREEELESEGTQTVRMKTRDVPKGTWVIGGQSWEMDSLQTTPAAHAKFSCHAIGIRRNGPGIEEIPLCTDRKQHPQIRTRREKQQAATSGATGGRQGGGVDAKSDRVREQLEAAAQSRHAFISQLLSGKTIAKEQLLDLVIDGYISEQLEIGEANLDFAAIALGLVDTDDDGVIVWPDGVSTGVVFGAFIAKSDTNRLRVAAALQLGWVEDANLEPRWNTHQPHWSRDAARHLELLGRIGYQLAPIEKQRMPKQTERTAA